MTIFIAGRNFPNRMDLLVEIARKIDTSLDAIDSGLTQSEEIVLLRGTRVVRITLSRDQTAHSVAPTTATGRSLEALSS